jgi:Fic-DOC domain mobile mystery protein B
VLLGSDDPDATRIDDISELLIKGITLRRELLEHEATNINKAILKYLGGKPNKRMAPFTESWARRLHGEMLGDVWGFAGRYRTSSLNIGIPWQQIETALHDMLENLKVWEGSYVERSARLHHRSVQIHPFRDGNGRWARLLTNIWLKLHGQSLIEWPVSLVQMTSTIRQEYVDALKAFDHGIELPLIELQSRYMSAAAQ